MSSREAESMAVSNKGNNASASPRLRRFCRLPTASARVTYEPRGRRRKGQKEPMAGIKRGRREPGGLRRQADTAQPRVRVPAALTQPRWSRVNPDVHRYWSKKTGEGRGPGSQGRRGASGSQTQHVSPEFLCLAQAARHVQTPDNLPLCLTPFHPSPPPTQAPRLLCRALSKHGRRRARKETERAPVK